MGPTIMATSPGASSRTVIMFRLFQITFSWLSTTPLGRPVVPEVYMSWAESHEFTFTGAVDSPWAWSISS